MKGTIGIAIGLLLGMVAGRFLAPNELENLPSTKRLVDYEQIERSMYAHQDSCVQDYEDGLGISEEIEDEFLKNRFLHQAGYLTHLEVRLSREIWMDNCMWQKEIYDRVGLGIP
jgi:hypothetical protein